MDNTTLIDLMERYVNHGLDPGEQSAFYAWLQDATPAEFHAALDQCANIPAEFRALPGMPEPFAQALGSRLDALDQDDRVVVLRPWKKWVAAAAVLLLLGAATWLVTKSRPQPALLSQAERFHNDVAPGHNTATLTLGNGQTIVLDSAATGALATQGNTRITKPESGQLEYKIGQERGPATIAYNILTTPRGGQYQLKLPDGTRVWLDAASSIRYPTAFTGNERNVEITGQVYFEVIHNDKMPFRVRAANTLIEDIGTSFNVNDYDDEPEQHIALLEGAIKIAFHAASAEDKAIQLRPGQQASVSAQGKIGIEDRTDLEEVMAWKNGQFRFRGAGIAAVLRQISRWYGVDIGYKTQLPEYPFVGTIPRDIPLSETLKLLELTGIVHFTIEGKTVTVLP
jgi:transmembrane sensor